MSDPAAFLQTLENPQEEARKRIIQSSPDPKAASEKLDAAAKMATVTGGDPKLFFNNWDMASEKVTGEKMKPANFIEKLKDTEKARQLDRQINQLSARQWASFVTGGKDDQIEKQIQALESEKPKETLGPIGGAIYNFVAQYGFEIPKQYALGETHGDLEHQVIDSAKNNAANAFAYVMLGPASISLTAVGGALGVKGLSFSGGGNVLKDINEQSIGAHFRTLIKDGGVSPTAARIGAAALTAAEDALNLVGVKNLPGMKEAIAGGGEAVAKTVLSGRAAKITLDAMKSTGIQTGIAYGLSLANEAATQFGRMLSGHVPTKDIPTVLKDAGIEAVPNIIIGAGMSMGAAGIEAMNYRFMPGSKQEQRIVEEIQKKETPVVPEIKSASDEHLATESIGDILEREPMAPVKATEGKATEPLRMTEAQGEALDKATRSEEGTADYVNRNPEIEKLNRQLEDLQSKNETNTEHYKTLLAEATEKARSIRAQISARKQVNDNIRKLKSVDTTHMHPEIAAAVHDLIGKPDDPIYNLTSPNKKTLGFAAEIKDYLANDPTADITDSQKALLDRASRKNFRDLTIEEQTSLVNQVMYYAKLQQDSTQVMLDGRRVDRAKAAEASRNEMPESKAVKDQTVRLSPNLWDRALKGKRWVKNLFGDHMMGLDYLTETVGGTRGDSIFHKIVFKQLHAGETPDAVRNGGETGALRYQHAIDDQQRTERQALIQKVRNVDAWRGQKVKEGNFDLTRGERVAMYMLWQQEASKRDLVEGFGSRGMPDPNNIHKASLDEWYSLMNSITPEEREAARALGVGFKKIGQDVNEQHIDVKNFPMDVVEDYFPIDVMPASRGTRAEVQEAKDLARSRYNIGLPKGRTMERTGAVKPIYVRDAFEVFSEHRDWAAQYIHVDQPLVNAVKLLRDSEAEITKRWGPDLYNEIDDRLHKVLGNADNETKVGRMMTRLRGSYVASVLNLNPISIAANLMNFERFVTAGFVKTSHATIGLMDSLVHPLSVHRELKTWSPLYRSYHAEGGFSKDMREALSEGGRNTVLGRSEKVFRRLTAYPSRFTDRLSTRAGMRGAFLQAMSEIKGGHLSTEVSTALGIGDSKLSDLTAAQKMSYAYRYAEHALEHVNHVPMSTLMSGLHQGNWFEQTLGTFGSDAVRAQQLYKQTVRAAIRDKSPKSFRRLAALTAGMFLLEPLHYIVLNYYRQQLMSNKKPPSLEDFKAAFSGDTSENAKAARRYMAFAFIDQGSYYYPIIRDVVRPASAAATGQYSQSSLLITDEYIHLATQATMAAAKLARGEGDQEKEWSKLIDNGTHMIFALKGIPYKSPQFWVKAAKDIAGQGDGQ